MNLQLNNIVADVLEASTDILSPTSIEIRSSEHLMFKIKQYNIRLEESILKEPDMSMLKD